MSHLLIHRGLAKKNFVENTISSFRYCFKKNYGIETDIHCTKDNKIVCFHDFNLKSKFKVNKSLKDIKYKDLLKISKLKKKPIPLLKDLIKLSSWNIIEETQRIETAMGTKNQRVGNSLLNNQLITMLYIMKLGSIILL